MDDEYGQPAAFRLVLGIVEALRGEFGAEIDAHPGGVGVEAGVVNRLLRVVVSCTLRSKQTSDVDLPVVKTRVLRQTALLHLEQAGIIGPRANAVLNHE